jgi:hypothetical protein
MIGWMAGFLGRRTPPCQDVVRLASELMDHPLPLRRWLALRLHVLVCALCERYRRQLAVLRLVVRHQAEADAGSAVPQLRSGRRPERQSKDAIPVTPLPFDVRERLRAALSRMR